MKSERSMLIITFGVLTAILFFLLALYSRGGAIREENRAFNKQDYLRKTEYVDKLFNRSNILEININIDEDEFDSMKENAMKEEFHKADIDINGEKLNDIGFRIKGNSSLSMLKQSGKSDRYSFKIKTDEYKRNQGFYGLSKIDLNNNVGDATQMKEYLAYYLMKDLGVISPEFSFAHIKINNNEWGLYLAVESLEDEFLERNFGEDYGNLYNIRSLIYCGTQKIIGKGSSLVYTDNDVNSYGELFSTIVTPRTNYNDKKRLIDIIKKLNTEEDLDECLDVDSILKYLAASVFLVNYDSYIGTQQNYFLYEKSGKMQVIPWDLNLSFSGNLTDDASKTANFPIDRPIFQGTEENSPLIFKLLEKEKYKEKYHNYLRQIIDTYINGGKLQTLILNLDKQIDEYVKQDANKLYTYEEYKNSIPNLIEFSKDRGRSIEAQLDGSEPSTEYGSIKSNADLKALGNQTQDLTGGVPVGNNSIMQVYNIVFTHLQNNELSEEGREMLKDMGLSDEDIDETASKWKFFVPEIYVILDEEKNIGEITIVLFVIMIFSIIAVSKFKRKRLYRFRNK